MNKILSLCSLLFLLLPVHVAISQHNTRYEYADAHLHFTNYLQQSQGMDQLLKQANQANIQYFVITGIGLQKLWDSRDLNQPHSYVSDDSPVYWYSLSDIIVARAITALDKEEQQRFYPFISGFNPNDMNAINHIEMLLDWYPDFWQGIGEIVLHHGYLSALMYGETPRANSESLSRIYTLAAKHNLPVLVHSDITSPIIKKPLYLKELTQALEQHPNTQFIWAHSGLNRSINRRQIVAYMPELIDKLLNEYKNLSIDLSWAVLDDYLLSEKNDMSQRWKAVVENHPNRFVIGSDSVGNFNKLPEKIVQFEPFLDQFSPEIATKLARDNIMGLMPRNQQRGMAK